MKVCFVYIYGLFHYICKFKYFSFCQNVVTPFRFSLKGTNRLKKKRKKKQKEKKNCFRITIWEKFSIGKECTAILN